MPARVRGSSEDAAPGASSSAGNRLPRGGGVRNARGVRQGAHVVEMQRRRLLTATTELVFERGVHGLTAVLISERAGVSRRTFHDIFEDREDCVLAAFEEVAAHATRIVRHAADGYEKWAERVRAGLTSLLLFLDEDPVGGRLLIVESLSAGPRTLQARGRVIAQVVAIVDQGRFAQAKTVREPPPLTAEGVVGAVFSVIHTRMLPLPASHDPQRASAYEQKKSLLELTGPLMAIIVASYLGPATARKELERPIDTPEHTTTPRVPSDPFKDLSIRLTYRTARVLATIAATPGASSKQVADTAGITDEGQTSKLLHRLQRNDLIQDTGTGPAKGQPRAWTLTTRGENILQAVGEK